ncbi:hypothetical protein KI387_033719 [Taxus chinensis]|uniref:Uncharacterized protein n=1 Tax=Taxus chinensis TaxID=29808 RepID=A0AA38F613_TAXCH|nr:hypothetical protein KI387_033719 [Taxus chinensis]
MSSPPTSSSLTSAQLIDQIVNTDENAPGFDLQQLVATIDSLLHHYNNLQAKSSHTREKVDSAATGMISASNASKFSEGVYENVKIIVSQISEYSGDKHQTSIDVLKAVGNVHWIGVGFLLVAAVIEMMDTLRHNKMERLRLLNSMNDLAKVIMRLQPLPCLNQEMQSKMKDSIHLIMEGAILCCSHKKRGKLSRVFKASNDKQDLLKLGKEVDDTCKMLNLQINTSTLEVVQRNLVPTSPPVPTLNEDAVGIEQKIDEVNKQLDWVSDKPTVAVVVYGLGGSGKTTLADAVYASLKEKLHGWRHSKVTFIQNLETDPNVEGLQSLILEDLTGMKQTVRDFQSGRRSLKDIMEKESIFLYIDNALYMEPLEKLLPKELKSAKKLRLLLTARDTNVAGVIEDCRIKPCEIYPMDALSVDAALQVLCRKIDRDMDISSIIAERPQAKEIAEKCSCCPLFLEVVGAYLHQRKNKVDAYKNVINFLESGVDFCGNKKFIFDESRVLFSYNELKTNAQEAFLDICSFFCNWEWEEVAWIVGEEEMDCLQDGALLKRKDGRISIHDLILSAGRNKSKCSRFTTAADLSIAMNNKELVSQIKGLWLRNTRCPFHISAQELDVMSRSLRVFAMGNLTIVEGKCNKQFDELRYFQVGRVPNLPMETSNLKHLSYIDYAFGKDMILSSSKNLSSLKVLKFDKCNDSRIIGITELPHLHNIKQLVLHECNGAEIPQSFYKLRNLQKLKLFACTNLTELPESLCKLRSLKEIYLSYCEMRILPAGFGELGSLTSLDLSGCKSLQELPCDLEKLSSLKSLNLSYCSSLLLLPERLGSLTSLSSLDIQGCKNLSYLPHSIGDLTSFSPSILFFNNCSSLSELPEEICKYTMLKNISLEGCSSLKMLPSRFSELTCLQTLGLQGCESLQELCNDFHCLVGLTSLYMQGCVSLSSLPLGFGNLSSLKALNLTGCAKLEQLCSDFHSLGALKDLTLSKCRSLSYLPSFGQLGCLETLNLRGCSNLENLSEDFSCLRSLIELDLSECERLGGEWMDSVVAIPSLWRVDIAGSEKMIQRCKELKREKEKWHFVVVTDFTAKATEQSGRALLLEGAISKVFDEEGLLFDNHRRTFPSSSLIPHTPLILIIDAYEFLSFEWELLEKRLQQLECNSKLFQIIYIGQDFDALPSELAMKILVHTPSSFCHKLFAHFQHYGGIFIFRSTVGLETNGIKCLSAWEDISYIRDEVEFLSRTPRESNIELLTTLLVTEKTDYILFNKTQQVKLADLRGKVILLLTASVGTSEMWMSALKEVYLKMQQSHKSLVEVVWTPRYWRSTWEEYGRAAANAPWPMVPDPWSLNKQLQRLIRNSSTPEVLVVDGKGRIRREDALPMIERYGVEAYPFSQSREEELCNTEWEGFKLNSQSTLEFIFQNREFLPAKAKEATSRGEMMLVCMGSATKMMEFAAPLISALSMLESDARILYVGHNLGHQPFHSLNENEYELQRNEICTAIPSLSFSDVFKFWRRVQYLQHDLNRMGTDEKIAKVRRMVLGLASADYNTEENEMGISMVAVDENAEMIRGGGMELVQLLCCSDEDNKEKLLMDIKSAGFQESIERRCKYGMTHPKHYTEHLVVKLKHVVALVPTDIDLPVFEPEPAFDASKPVRLVTTCSSTSVPITVPHVVYPTSAQLHGFFGKHTTTFRSRMLRSMGLTSRVIDRHSQGIVSSIPHVKWNSCHDIGFQADTSLGSHIDRAPFFVRLTLSEDHEQHMSSAPSLRLEKYEISTFRHDQPDTHSDVLLHSPIVHFAPSHMQASSSSIRVDLGWIFDHSWR